MFWPALLAASLLAWTQALTWMPYALPGLRVIITVLWLAAIDAIVTVALNFKAGELVMLAILAPHVPLAYATARFAIARARRGDEPDWRPLFLHWDASPFFLGGANTLFAGPRADVAGVAAAWPSLPALVGIVLPFALALLFVFRETPALVFEMLIVALTTPPLMAVFAAATVGGSNMTRFIATRPVTSASLIAVKLKVTIWSTLAAGFSCSWAIPSTLKLSGTLPLVIEPMHRLAEVIGAPHAAVAVLLVFAALVAVTWKQLVQSLYIGMSGREWLLRGASS